MMANPSDMSTPVTRGELKEELEQFRAEIRTEFRAEIRQAIAPLATKAELETWGGALLALIRSELQAQLSATQRQLQLDLARHAGALHESMSALLTAHDEKYADLPPRVKRLEAAVFEPEQH